MISALVSNRYLDGTGKVSFMVSGIERHTHHPTDTETNNKAARQPSAIAMGHRDIKHGDLRRRKLHFINQHLYKIIYRHGVLRDYQ